MRRSSKEIAGEIFLLRILVPHSCPAFSFPNSVWERTFAKLCFAGLVRRETEFGNEETRSAGSTPREQVRPRALARAVCSGTKLLERLPCWISFSVGGGRLVAMG